MWDIIYKILNEKTWSALHVDFANIISWFNKTSLWKKFMFYPVYVMLSMSISSSQYDDKRRVFLCVYLAGKAEWASWACKAGCYIQPENVKEERENLLSSLACEYNLDVKTFQDFSPGNLANTPWAASL